MTMNDDFTQTIINFIADATVDIERVRINAQKDLVAGVISDTRVDTGLARRNWQAKKDSIPTSVIEYAGAPTGSNSVADAMAVAFGTDGTFYFVNNLHYVYYLEFGTSRTAGDGMARNNAQRVATTLRAGGYN